MFAGPNGSGKSELKKHFPFALLGVYLNPVEIEKEIRQQDFLDLNSYGVKANVEELLTFFAKSSFLISAEHENESKQLGFEAGRLIFNGVAVNLYFASVAVDFLRQKLLEQKISFTLETVMSHRSKIDLLVRAQRLGYRTYLYFVATDDPAINISRVRNRVLQGGHAVPEEKLKSVISVRWICCWRPSATRIALTFSTIPQTRKITITLGSRKLRTAKLWN